MTIDLTTTYLGLNLRSPLVVSASPLSENVGNIKYMSDVGAGAVVLYSLFEEQVEAQQHELHHFMNYGSESYAEALSYVPDLPHFHVSTNGYLNLIRHAKGTVNIPIIASLNGYSHAGWTSFARQIEEAGADALELNIYYIPTDPDMSAAEIEQNYLDILIAVRDAVKIPIAVKLSPYFSNVANMAKRLDQAGANGLVLFNRFYQPDIDLELLEVRPNVLLSTPQAQRLPLRWIAILHGRIQADLAATSGIHDAEDVVKMLMVGAKVTMMASTLLKHGIGYLADIEERLIEWLEAHEYESVRQIQGSLSQINCPDPSLYERSQYMKALTGYRPFMGKMPR